VSRLRRLTTSVQPSPGSICTRKCECIGGGNKGHVDASEPVLATNRVRCLRGRFRLADGPGITNSHPPVQSEEKGEWLRYLVFGRVQGCTPDGGTRSWPTAPWGAWQGWRAAQRPAAAAPAVPPAAAVAPARRRATAACGECQRECPACCAMIGARAEQSVSCLLCNDWRESRAEHGAVGRKDD